MKLILLLVSLCCAKAIVNSESNKNNLTYDIPQSGFFLSNTVDTAVPIAFKSIRQINYKGFCHTLKLINIPDPNPSPLVGDEIFILHNEDMANNHYYWHNGAEYISYVSVEGNDYGNWLIGTTPGVDSGYVYLRTNQPSITPVGIEDSTSNQWNWLMDGVWKPQPEMKLICIDEYESGSKFFEVEYFDQDSGEGVVTHLIPDIHPAMITNSNKNNRDFSTEAVQAKGKSIAGVYPAYFDPNLQSWIELEGIKTVVKFGTPVLISNKDSDSSNVAVLVNAEHSGRMGWRLIMRNYPFARTKKPITGRTSKNEAAISTDGSTFDINNNSTDLERIIDDRRYLVSKSERLIESIQIAPDTSAVSRKPRIAADSAEQEFEFELTSDGIVDGYEMTALYGGLKRNFQRTMQHIFSNVQPGEYVWLWYTPMPVTKRVNSKDLTADSANGYRTETVSESGGVLFTPQTETVIELLLRCYARTDDTILFQYYESHRRDVMHQSMLEKDTDLLVVHCSHKSSLNPGNDDSSSCNRFLAPVILLRGRSILVHSMINLGNDLLDYLWRHLEDKEGTPSGLSSCYMYHAAVSMPQPLIYAAEILCVLIGAKPAVMIQYVTPSDHQWKFPLIPELSRAIIAAKKLLGPNFEFDYDIFKYRNDQTLVIYRTSRKYIIEGLLPYYEAQALHPVPYPDINNLDNDYNSQIYNSAMNGFMLGYPEFFVQSYCLDFHNDLDYDRKLKQYSLAKKDFELYLESHNQAPHFIHIGLDEPIDDRDFNVIKRLL